MSGGVDHVDLGVAVFDADVFRKDGDAAFALQVVAVEKALGDDFIFAEDFSLPHDLVDQRGLAVVNVGDDCDVSQVAHKGSCSPAQFRMLKSISSKYSTAPCIFQ
ncbi:hypothetical protein SDC9_208347 [bioreactor metagenome]|uniref:Uncharacterized protein n=1 Tax=bioreactor metagenome TaxID=1076179 RepID=A0A645JAD4_9ZZZZ